MKLLKIKNKKAEGTLLGEHVIEIIVASFVILFLVGFGYILYSMFAGELQSNSEKASASMNTIKVAIEKLKVDGDSQEVSIFSPTAWMLNFWSDELAEIPKNCDKTKLGCICICEQGLVISCDSKNGACFSYDKRISMVRTMVIDKLVIEIKEPLPIKLNVSLENDEIKIEQIK